MITYDILVLLGVPSVCLILWTYLFRRVKKAVEENEAIKHGVQAMLRSQMIAEFNVGKEKGYAPIYAKENFENLWKNYHALGANGVMNNVKERYMGLPNRKEDRIRGGENNEH